MIYHASHAEQGLAWLHVLWEEVSDQMKLLVHPCPKLTWVNKTLNEAHPNAQHRSPNTERILGPA